jgi:hypothetical protein
MVKGTIQAIWKGKCNPPHASITATIIEQKKPQKDKIFGVNPWFMSSLTG